ncbi:hypothetical protein SteCoe_15552 [Stentor coeruleus]|uniref:Uncharacterized protein n=1 Tax=Stentor coeruleus TaxID=5963 RepID=A0A1R2C3G7_9CILI|nr:hypothetical protein SteCoe_15552 [Stentor coeruleus]
MFLQNQYSTLTFAKDSFSCPKTPTLPALKETLNEKLYSERKGDLKIITKVRKNAPSLSFRHSRGCNFIFYDVPTMKNLMSEFEKVSDENNSTFLQIEHKETFSKSSMRSLSTSSNDQIDNNMHEINTLNNKIRSLIKDQDHIRDKRISQENISIHLQKNIPIKPIFINHDQHNYITPSHISFDERYFSMTFKPQDKWLPQSRKFPREVFCKQSKFKQHKLL